jgi:serine/threonine-protein kinase
MAPEQALGHWDEVDGRTDIWAVGATMFTLLSGRHVHEADTVQAELVLAATRPAGALQGAVPNAPSDFASVVDHALCFTMSERYGDARSMQAALRAVISTNTPLTVPGASPEAAGRFERDSAPSAPNDDVTDASIHGVGVTRSAPLSIAREGRNRFMLVVGGVLAAGILIAVGRWSNAPAPSPTAAASSLVPPAPPPVVSSLAPPAASAAASQPVPSAAAPLASSPAAPSARVKARVKASSAPLPPQVPLPADNPFDLRH